MFTREGLGVLLAPGPFDSDPGFGFLDGHFGRLDLKLVLGRLDSDEHSFASIEPPLLNFGETQATRPATCDLSRALADRLTAPVSPTVSAWRVCVGRMTLTTGLVSCADSAETVSRCTRSGARAKYRATAMTARIETI